MFFLSSFLFVVKDILYQDLLETVKYFLSFYFYPITDSSINCIVVVKEYKEKH